MNGDHNSFDRELVIKQQFSFKKTNSDNFQYLYEQVVDYERPEIVHFAMHDRQHENFQKYYQYWLDLLSISNQINTMIKAGVVAVAKHYQYQLDEPDVISQCYYNIDGHNKFVITINDGFEKNQYEIPMANLINEVDGKRIVLNQPWLKKWIHLNTYERLLKIDYANLDRFDHNFRIINKNQHQIQPFNNRSKSSPEF